MGCCCCAPYITDLKRARYGDEGGYETAAWGRVWQKMLKMPINAF